MTSKKQWRKMALDANRAACKAMDERAKLQASLIDRQTFSKEKPIYYIDGVPRTDLDVKIATFTWSLFREHKNGSGIAKLPEEVQEFIEDPCLEEAADVLICVLVELHQRGFHSQQLLDAVEAKMKVNLERTWTRQEDGTYHHN